MLWMQRFQQEQGNKLEKVLGKGSLEVPQEIILL